MVAALSPEPHRAVSDIAIQRPGTGCAKFAVAGTGCCTHNDRATTAVKTEIAKMIFRMTGNYSETPRALVSFPAPG
jgi:hypothetical protein